VDLTDIHQTDRRRPDRAIDVLDEACAHTHAVANYSPKAESLIRRRQELLREQKSEARQAQREERVFSEDPIDNKVANALEQFGAELEAIFIGGPAPSRSAPKSRAETPPPPPEKSEEQPVREPPQLTLGGVESELAATLMEEGIVVRGIDVARVVAVATGREVTWAA
jgi:ATP-dependent Clp protease ATP-binding subunit ClpA